MSIRTTSSSPSRRAPARPSRPVSLTSHRSNLNPSTSRLRFLPSRRPLSRKPNRRRRRLVSRSPRTRARRPRASSAPLHAPFPSSASSTGAAISAFNRTAARAVVHRSPRQSPSPFSASPSSRVFPRARAFRPRSRRTVVRQRVVRPRVVDDVDRAPVRAHRAVLHRRRLSRVRRDLNSTAAGGRGNKSISWRSRCVVYGREVTHVFWVTRTRYEHPRKRASLNPGRSVGRSVGRRVGASRAMIIAASG